MHMSHAVCYLKIAVSKVIQTKIYVSGILLKHVMVSIVFKTILGSFGAFVSKLSLTRKQLDVEEHQLKFETQGH